MPQGQTILLSEARNVREGCIVDGLRGHNPADLLGGAERLQRPGCGNVVLRDHADADEAKYRDQFRRRVQSGRCYSRPYLGCREFAAEFGEVQSDERPVDFTDDLGLMLHDLTYATDGSGRGTPVFFQAQVEQGVLQVPRLEGNHVTAKVG